MKLDKELKNVFKWSGAILFALIFLAAAYSPLNTSVIRIFNSSNGKVSLLAPSSLGAGSVSLTLPDTDGATGQCFTSDGSGLTDWSSCGSGGSKSWITGDDADFENSIGAWATYDDGAAATPVNGTGGTSSTLTVTRTTTGGEVLAGAASLKIAKSAADGQGEGVSIPFTIDVNQQGQMQSLPFVFKTGSNYVNEHWQFFVYDVTNAQVLNVFTLGCSPTLNDCGKLFTTPTNGTTFSGVFFPSGSSTSYRLIAHQNSTSAVAFDLLLDEVKPGPVGLIGGYNATDFESYDPGNTPQGFGTITNKNFLSRRNGENLEIIASFTAGTTNGSEAQMPLPTGLVISSKLTAQKHVGAYFRNATSTSHGGPVKATAGDAFLNFGNIGIFGAGNVDPATDEIGTNVLATGNTMSFFASIPIQGWQSSTVMSQHQAQLQTISVRASGDPASATALNPVIFPTKIWDDYNIYSISTGQLTAPRKGRVIVFGFLMTPGDPGPVLLYVNGASVMTVGDPGTSAEDFTFIGSAEVEKGQTVDIRPTNTTNFEASSHITFLFIPDLSVIGILGSNIGSPSSGRMMLATAFITNSGTPTVSREDGDWLGTVTDVGAGVSTLAINTGIFSSVPNCQCTVYSGAGRTCEIDSGSAISATSVRVRTQTDAGTPSDNDFFIQCIGPRGTL